MAGGEGERPNFDHRRSEAPKKVSTLREVGRYISSTSREAVKQYFKPLTTIYEYVKGDKTKQPSSGKKN
ncbi:MAG TPA: hypothetical protein VGE97_03195 [Nitrososphaera sp.]|jgi:hypothetical protein